MYNTYHIFLMVNAKKGVEQIGGKKNEVSSYKKKIVQLFS